MPELRAAAGRLSPAQSGALHGTRAAIVLARDIGQTRSRSPGGPSRIANYWCHCLIGVDQAFDLLDR
eukprot:5842821-Pyramimonas_sp.AAC.1